MLSLLLAFLTFNVGFLYFMRSTNSPEKSFVYVRNFNTRVSWSLGLKSDGQLLVSRVTEKKAGGDCRRESWLTERRPMKTIIYLLVN